MILPMMHWMLTIAMSLALFFPGFAEESFQHVAIDGWLASGSFPPAVVVDLSKGKLVLTAAQSPVDPQTGQMIEGSIQDATCQALNNMKRVLKASGTSFANVMKIDVVLKEMKDFAGMEDAYIRYFGRMPLPLRSTSQFDIPVRIEISCLAFIPAPLRCEECEKGAAQ